MHVTFMLIFNKRISSWLPRQFVTDDFNLKVEKRKSLLNYPVTFLVYCYDVPLLDQVSKSCLCLVYQNLDWVSKS